MPAKVRPFKSSACRMWVEQRRGWNFVSEICPGERNMLMPVSDGRWLSRCALRPDTVGWASLRQLIVLRVSER